MITIWKIYLFGGVLLVVVFPGLGLFNSVMRK